MHSRVSPVNQLYSLLDGMPKVIQQEALATAGAVIGMTAKPTGLEVTAERNLRHLYWDISVSEFHGHLTRFIEATGCDAVVVVRKLIDEVEGHFRTYSGQVYAGEYRQYLEDTIADLFNDKEKAYENRISLLSDNEIVALIGKLRSTMSVIESREQAIGDVLQGISEIRNAISHG